jgi:hypothetical protein
MLFQARMRRQILGVARAGYTVITKQHNYYTLVAIKILEKNLYDVSGFSGVTQDGKLIMKSLATANLNYVRSWLIFHNLVCEIKGNLWELSHIIDSYEIVLRSYMIQLGCVQ